MTQDVKPNPIDIPKFYFETFSETSIGLMRVAEQLEATAASMRNGRPVSIESAADEIGMWASVLDSLRKRFDAHVEQCKAEPEDATAARCVASASVGA